MLEIKPTVGPSLQGFPQGEGPDMLSLEGMGTLCKPLTFTLIQASQQALAQDGVSLLLGEAGEKGAEKKSRMK